MDKHLDSKTKTLWTFTIKIDNKNPNESQIKASGDKSTVTKPHSISISIGTRENRRAPKQAQKAQLRQRAAGLFGVRRA